MTRAQSKVLTQVVTIGLLGLFIYLIARITAANLERIGITTGFGFLTEPAGFEIAFSLFDFSSFDRHLDVFWVGIANTLLAATLSIILCTIIGFLVGIAQLSSNKLTAAAARCYVEAFRNIPLLLNIFFWYFITINIFPRVADSFEFGGIAFLNQRGLFLPKLSFDGASLLVSVLILLVPIVIYIVLSKRPRVQFRFSFAMFACATAVAACLLYVLFSNGWLSAEIDIPRATRFNIAGGIEIMPELFALVIGLSIYHGAFMAEYVRGGLLAVSKGQTEAALSTGLSNWQTMRFVVVPQALRVIIPPYISNNLNVLKNSSLGSAIAYPELVNVFAGTSLNQTGNAIEIILMVMAFYFTFSMLISLVLNIYNKRIQLVER